MSTGALENKLPAKKWYGYSPTSPSHTAVAAKLISNLTLGEIIDSHLRNAHKLAA